MATYKERYLPGEIEFEEIDEYSYQWGMSDDEQTLAIPRIKCRGRRCMG